MLRKIGFTVLCVAASISTAAHSISTHSLQPGLTLEYDLPPNDPQMFVNYMFWSVEANCKITTKDASDELYAEVIVKKATVNGSELSQGQSIKLTVAQGQNLKIAADSGAKVKITNLGKSLVKATCSS